VMRPSISFIVHGKAVPKGSMRAFMPKGHKFPVLTSTSGKNLKNWEQSIRGELQAAMNLTHPDITKALFDAPIAVGIRFHMPRPKSKKKAKYPTSRPDIDKLARSAVDALSTIVFRDDAQVVALQVRKVYAESGAKAEITVESWGD
jgi:Holliday junction resolvase RusA-like endonuclease